MNEKPDIQKTKKAGWVIIGILLLSSFCIISSIGIGIYYYLELNKTAIIIEDTPVSPVSTPTPIELATQTSKPSETESGEIDFSGIGGKYVGVSTINDNFEESRDGQESSNVINLRINRNGKITGSFFYGWVENWNTENLEWEEYDGGPVHYCISMYTLTFEGDITGQMSDEKNGTIEITIHDERNFTYVDCPESKEDIDNTYTVTMNILVEDNQITSTETDDFPITFEAVREE